MARCWETAMKTVLANREFQIEFDPRTGSIERLTHPEDAHRMNLVLGKEEHPWRTLSHGWGTGYFVVDHHIHNGCHRWDTPSSMDVNDQEMTVTYDCGPLAIAVRRFFNDAGNLVERYVMTNQTGEDKKLTALGINTPINDSYPSAEICMTNRAQAHIWTGHHAAYINAMRMGGEPPHLGMVLTEGYLTGYSIDQRGPYLWSEIRGVISLNVTNTFLIGPHEDMAPVTLKAGQSLALQFELFWHDGWDSFMATATSLNPLIGIHAERYTVKVGEPITVHIPESCADVEVVVDKKSIDVKTGLSSVPTERTGHHTIRATTERGTAILNVYAVSDPMNRIQKRVEFIVDRQQLNDPDDIRDGAYMVYDNMAEAILLNHERADMNDSRERLGMGVLIARFLRLRRSQKLKKSIMRYHRFVRERMQDEDYVVYDDAAHTHCRRVFNYPWVAHFYFELFKTFGDERYLRDYYHTMKAYYAREGARFYGFYIPMRDGLRALEEAGLTAEREDLAADFRRHADRIIENGLLYPTDHEANFEQLLPAAATLISLESYMVTGEEKYLEAARLSLRCLEGFNGFQPDYHLHDIAIRHWDGYWFGWREMWGDTLPHYWSAVTGLAFHRYWEVTGEEAYRTRAEHVVENNLCLFTEDGRGSAAFIYPLNVNGEAAHVMDPYANDQDWALVFYLMVFEHIYGGG